MRTLQAYVGAMALARRVRDLGSVSPATALAFARAEPSISPNQKEVEILWLLERLAACPPRAVLEIGTDRGGTLFLWTRVAARDAVLLSVDIQKMVGRLGRLSPFALVRRSFRLGRQRIVLVDNADSRDAQTVDRVKAVLDGRPVDFLFLDGDHRYESVRRDFELYEPLVRPGGIIALHDISSKTTHDTEGTAAFWAELKQTNAVEELIADGAPGYGIGVYCKPR